MIHTAAGGHLSQMQNIFYWGGPTFRPVRQAPDHCCPYSHGSSQRSIQGELASQKFISNLGVI